MIVQRKLFLDSLCEEDELLDYIISLETERDLLKSKLSEIIADIKYLLQHGENIYIRRKYIRGDTNDNLSS